MPKKRMTLFSKLWTKQRGNCHLCGRGMSREQGKPNTATFDHIIPKSKMRDNCLGHVPNNKKLACRQCNIWRGNLPVLEAKKFIRDKLKGQDVIVH